MVLILQSCNPAPVPEQFIVMAAYVNRTISLVSGDDPVVRTSSVAVGPMGDAQSLRDSSSLQIFIKAKKKINDIFVEIEDYVLDAVSYMKSKCRAVQR
jgi:mitofusin